LRAINRRLTDRAKKVKREARKKANLPRVWSVRDFYKIHRRRKSLTRFCTRFGRRAHFYGLMRPTHKSIQPYSDTLKALIGHVRKRTFFKRLFGPVTRKKKENCVRHVDFLVVKKTKNNIFVGYLRGRSRRLIKYFSAGLAGFKGPKKSSATGASAAGACMGTYLLKNYIKKNIAKNFIIVLKTPASREMSELIMGLHKQVPWLEERILCTFTNFKTQHGLELRRKKKRRL